MRVSAAAARGHSGERRVSDPETVVALQEELAANARARIPLYLAGMENAELRALEARAVVLRAAIRAASPPPSWEQLDRRLGL
jgi:hypothetical protein